MEIQKLKRVVPLVFFLKRKRVEMAVQDFESCTPFDEFHTGQFGLKRMVSLS